MACRRGGHDRIQKISKIWAYNVRGAGGGGAGGQCMPEESACPFPPLLGGQRAAAHCKPNGLLLSVRAHLVICNRSGNSGKGKCKICLGSNSCGRAYCFFTPVSLCAFPIGRAGIGGYWNCNQKCSRFGHEQDNGAKKAYHNQKICAPQRKINPLRRASRTWVRSLDGAGGRRPSFPVSRSRRCCPERRSGKGGHRWWQ